MEDPGPAPPRGSERPPTPSPPPEADVLRLFSRVVDLGDGIDPLDLAGEDGFVWRSPGGALVGIGHAARVPVGADPGRIERAAEAVAALLDAIEVDDADGTGLGPAAVGALPFHPATPGELVVPALLLRSGPGGRTWAVVTEPAPFAPPAAADLLTQLRAGALRDHSWPTARRLDGPWPTVGTPSTGGGPAATGSGPPPTGSGPAATSGGPAPTGGGLWTAGSPRSSGEVASPTGGPGAGPGGSGPAANPGGGTRWSGLASGVEWWRGAVRAALAAIGAGRLDKVVLAREAVVEADRPFPRGELLRRLRGRSGGPTYLYACGGFVGASPELLVRRQGRVAVSRPMAGTVPRGDSASAEADGLARLTGSPKEAVEHRLVVDAVAEGLAKVADRVEVGRPEVVRLSTVAHLATEITADLTGPLPSALELAALLHPTPAVGGSPREAALAAIATLEPFDRGCYAGPVGWVDHAGDGEWAVAIRCATLAGRRAHLIAGAGVVPGSDPDAEWAETEHKLRAMLEVLLSP
jgi:menaquinone-specific isochorismate synthase